MTTIEQMKDINDILAKHFSGETNPEEAKLVAEWRQENEAEYARLEEAWNETDLSLLKGFEFKNFDSKTAWQKVDSKLIDHKEVKIIKFNFYKKVAAACAILMVGFAGFWFLNRGGGFETVSNMASTPKEVSLPDGTTVWLASNSTLDYKSDFKNDRSLKLDGEAFFEVAPDKAHPFIISTQLGEVEVLGTGFNVNATEKSTSVTVSHGKVALRNTNKDAVELTAGESANTDLNGLLSTVVPAEPNYNAWKTGVFKFDNTLVSDVAALLTKHYGKKIELNDPKIGDERIDGYFDNQPLEDIIDVIVLTCGVNAEYGEDTIRLR